MLAGAVSAEATPRAGLGGTDIVVDESPREQAGQDVSAHSSGTDGSGLQVVQQAQHAAVQQARQAAAAAQPQRQMSPIVQQLVSRLRSNAAAAADAGATGSEQQALAALRTISGSMGRSRPGSASHAAVPSPLSRAASRAVAGTAAASNAAANSVTAASSGFSSADGGKLSQRWLSHPGLSLQSCLSRPAGQGQPQEQPPGTPAVSAFAGGSFSAAGASAGGDIGGGSTSMPGNGQGPLPQDAAETAMRSPPLGQQVMLRPKMQRLEGPKSQQLAMAAPAAASLTGAPPLPVCTRRRLPAARRTQGLAPLLRQCPMLVLLPAAQQPPGQAALV